MPPIVDAATRLRDDGRDVRRAPRGLGRLARDAGLLEPRCSQPGDSGVSPESRLDRQLAAGRCVSSSRLAPRPRTPRPPRRRTGGRAAVASELRRPRSVASQRKRSASRASLGEGVARRRVARVGEHPRAVRRPGARRCREVVRHLERVTLKPAARNGSPAVYSCELEGLLEHVGRAEARRRTAARAARSRPGGSQSSGVLRPRARARTGCPRPTGRDRPSGRGASG